MSIRIKLLELFDGKAGTVLSGERLAHQLGVSRTAVWKQVQTLKSSGLPIEGTGRQGYRLQVPFDSSLVAYQGPKRVTPHYFLNTVSTQSLSKAGAAAGLPEGHLWIAETQSKGRGRLDRVWESTYGGLWFSLLLRPKLTPSRLAPLTLVAGLSLRDAVESVCGVALKLKWPNDLVTDSPRRKIAGILTEMSGQIDRTEWMTMGVGLNVNNTLSTDLAARAETLYGLTGRVWERARLLDAFLAAFFENYALYAKEGFEPFHRRYWKHYFAPENPVSLHTASGNVSGTACGVDANGALMIESRRKIRTFTEGEITL